MILLRRLLTIPLVLLFLLLLFLSLIILRVNSTLLEPEFYKEQLVKGDIYNFLLDDLITAGVDELREKEPEFFPGTMEENPLITLSLTTDDVVSAVKTTFPPSWVQEQVEQVIDQAGGYITGERDDFEITILAAERARTFTEEVETLIRKAQVYDLLFDEILSTEVDEALEKQGALPFDVPLTGEEIIDSVRRIAPEEWVKEQVELALDEVTAYAVGDQDSFEVKVLLGERVDVALAEIIDLLRKANFTDLLFDQVIDPTLRGLLPSLTQLPFGVAISEEEVIASLHQVAPPDWVQEQVEGIIDETGLYLTGKQDGFQAVIPLAERKEVVLTVIGDLALTKLEELIEGLPECDIGQLPFSGGLPSLNELPVCVPPGIQPQLLIDTLNVDVASLVESMIGDQIPDSMIYTEADLRQAMTGGNGDGSLDIIDDLREIVSQGWTYTDVDLLDDLGDNVDTLDDVRAALSDGWTYTEVDLLDDLADAGGGEVLDNLDRFRSGLSRARSFQYLIYAPLVLLLAIIALLGGRRLWSKVAWAAAVLGIASAIVFAASGPVYDIAKERLVDNARAEGLADMKGTGLLAGEKGIDIVQTVADNFVSGITQTSLILMVVALVVFVASQVWGTMSIRSRPPQT